MNCDLTIVISDLRLIIHDMAINIREVSAISFGVVFFSYDRYYYDQILKSDMEM